MRRSMLRFPHKADIYEKTYEVQPSGQRKPTWVLSQEGMQCQFNPDRTSIRVNPTSEETEKVIVYLPADAVFDYTSRIQDIRDRKGTVILAGPFEVVKILSFPGYGGRLHHYYVQLETVIE